VADLAGVAWPPEPLRTERLVLRSTQASDRPAAIELLCSEEVRRFVGGPLARADVEGAMPEVPSAYPGVFAIEFEVECVGVVTMDRRDRERPGHVRPGGDELEVSYSLLPAYWGRGLAAEAVEAVLRWTWSQFPDEPVVLCTQRANERSLALASRLAFVETGRFTEFDAEQWLGVRWPLS
jgi:RimJ/RimL family protein N-acetyltransferase